MYRQMIRAFVALHLVLLVTVFALPSQAQERNNNRYLWATFQSSTANTITFRDDDGNTSTLHFDYDDIDPKDLHRLHYGQRVGLKIHYDDNGAPVKIIKVDRKHGEGGHGHEHHY